MVKLVDALDSKSSGPCARASSILASGTNSLSNFNIFPARCCSFCGCCSGSRRVTIYNPCMQPSEVAGIGLAGSTLLFPLTGTHCPDSFMQKHCPTPHSTHSRRRTLSHSMLKRSISAPAQPLLAPGGNRYGCKSHIKNHTIMQAGILIRRILIA